MNVLLKCLSEHNLFCGDLMSYRWEIYIILIHVNKKALGNSDNKVGNVDGS